LTKINSDVLCIYGNTSLSGGNFASYYWHPSFYLVSHCCFDDSYLFVYSLEGEKKERMTPFENLEREKATHPSYLFNCLEYCSGRFLLNYISNFSQYVSSCKEMVGRYTHPKYYKQLNADRDKLLGDPNNNYPNLIRVIFGTDNGGKSIYEKFRKTESEFGLPESKITILNFEKKGNSKPFSVLVLHDYKNLIEKEVGVLLIKTALGQLLPSHYYDRNGIVEKIFSNLSFYMPIAFSGLMQSKNDEDLISSHYTNYGIYSWARDGYLNKVLTQNP